MIQERKCEFSIMLHLERLASVNREFAEHLHNNYDMDKFNKRYRELLDEFLNDYALNNTEKSD